jgi:hypothetical protein
MLMLAANWFISLPDGVSDPDWFTHAWDRSATASRNRCT